ncbi:MAG: small subunit ribosomal protein S3 [Parcubacteria group bacterium Gr01-1014_18]|nr:MAG: small subunit ribosomal protein S3 [Parcubacteria group bacterium Greene0416_36]TSC80258.1 MAG: small subunit ribosomal protein S3 [Parcubacteria group bacterium Gr01-1014_18]TSC98237.1 MAG: small subunit ribosomal protein S3 [Parcubacteria group bacterium Greene1014_20]TSD07020.1 MAG: small subunit ribosomal protein S3 [Parcubacteria group bacterium Greene0714_2]
MGQKVNPIGFRIATIYTWPSRWVSRRAFSTFLKEDVKIREYLQKKLKEALVDKIEIERNNNHFTITIQATKPGLIIGKGGAGVEDLKNEIQHKLLGRKENIDLNIVELKKPMLSAKVVMQTMAYEIEKRVAVRRAMKQTIAKVMKEGAKGVKILVSGRINGSEIARRETLSAGKLPLHTLRAEIDFAKGGAFTTYGVVGIKVWIYKGEVFEKEQAEK